MFFNFFVLFFFYYALAGYTVQTCGTSDNNINKINTTLQFLLRDGCTLGIIRYQYNPYFQAVNEFSRP